MKKINFRLVVGVIISILVLAISIAEGSDRSKLMEFMYALEKGDTNTAQAMLKKGLNVNAKLRSGGTALMNCAAAGHLKGVRFLLDKKADVNLANKHGYTALIYASKGGYLEIVKLLVISGADIRMKTKRGDTAMSVANASGHLHIVQFLMRVDRTDNRQSAMRQ